MDLENPAPTAAPDARARQGWGIRKRATATAVAVVAAALVVGGIILVVLLQSSLMAATESAARQKAQDVVAQLADQDVNEAAQYIASTAHAGQIVQILDEAGKVTAASVPGARTAPVSRLRPAAGEILRQDVSGLESLGVDDDFLIVAAGAETNSGIFTVLVADTVQVQTDTVTTVGWFVLGATPVLLAVVGISVWMLVGRSLRQVERIRSQVAAINAQRLDERVDVPPTGDEITALASTMNGMLERLEASDREQRRFVADASHELRSPVATLAAAVEIAAADSSGETWNSMKDVLAGETARLGYLIEDLLTLAKSNDGTFVLAVTDVDLDDVLDQEIRRLRSTSGHRINAHLSPARVTGDARRLGQVLRNVLDNANRHARSSITVRLASGTEGTVLTIDNDGPPVPAQERQRVFERFVRLDESRSRESGGSGLGLAIAAGIMSSHHGTVSATETSEGECRFILTLPPATPGTAPRS